MFKAITYKNAVGPGPLIDIGALAEGLLFYEKVFIVGNQATFQDILSRIPPFIFLSLMQSNRLECYFASDHAAVTSNNTNGRLLHNLVQISMRDQIIEKAGFETFKKIAGDTSQAKLGAKKFANLLKPISHEGFDQKSLLQTLTEEGGVENSVRHLIQEMMPDYTLPRDMRFKFERENNGLFVDTNLDFSALNSHYHKSVPIMHSTLSEAYILAIIQEAHTAAYYAAFLDTEVAVRSVERVIQSSAIDAVLKKYSKSQDQANNFIEMTLENANAIREAVNSGVVPFSSIVKLLDKADKFRHWLHQQPSDASILNAYYEESIRETWAEKLPTKILRWGVFAGIGLAIDALGAEGFAAIAASALDAFLMDKLMKGWKPHQFIEKDLKTLFKENQR